MILNVYAMSEVLDMRSLISQWIEGVSSGWMSHPLVLEPLDEQSIVSVQREDYLMIQFFVLNHVLVWMLRF
jgi:hypothetical protein